MTFREVEVGGRLPGVRLLGASISVGHSWLNSSMPLIRLTADEAGIRVVSRSTLSSTFFSFAQGEMTDGRIGWTASWADLERVMAGRRSVILHAHGKRPSQFLTLKRRPIAALAQMVEAHGVPVERVRSTYFRRLDRT